MTLTVVPIHPDEKRKIQTLHERLIDTIYAFDAENNSIVTRAEIVGTLEFVKAEIMRTLK